MFDVDPNEDSETINKPFDKHAHASNFKSKGKNFVSIRTSHFQMSDISSVDEIQVPTNELHYQRTITNIKE